MREFVERLADHAHTNDIAVLAIHENVLAENPFLFKSQLLQDCYTGDVLSNGTSNNLA